MQLLPVDLVRGDVELPSLSEIYQRFTKKLDDPTAKAEDFAEIISSDPALTIRVLKLVNSAYYSFNSEISSIEHAVTILGLRELRDLVLAISVLEFFEGLPNSLINMHKFWNHSVLTGLIAKELQKAPSIKTTESIFTAGMLHDVGSLVFYNRLPEIARSVLERHEREDKQRYEIEQSLIGFDHAAIGGELMSHWRLPEFLVESVGCHHQPGNAKHFAEEATLVNLSDSVARRIEDGESTAGIREGIDLPLGLNTAQLEAAMENANENLSSVMSSLSVG